MTGEVGRGLYQKNKESDIYIQVFRNAHRIMPFYSIFFNSQKNHKIMKKREEKREEKREKRESGRHLLVVFFINGCFPILPVFNQVFV